MPVNIYIHIHIDKNIYITYVYIPVNIYEHIYSYIDKHICITYAYTNTYHLNWRNNYASEYKYIHVHN
jgi:hypothetical protein